MKSLSRKLLLLLSGASIFASLCLLSACSSTGTLPTYNKDAAILPAQSELSITVMDVGQGDSILVRFPDSRLMLIDGGDKGKGQTVLENLQQRGQTNIAILVITHTDSDHIGGLPEILKGINLENVYMPGKKCGAYGQTKSYQKLMDGIEQKKLNIIEATEGLYVISNAQVQCRFLSPKAHAYKNKNCTSACLFLRHGQTRAFFSGDAETEVEEELIRDHAPELKSLSFLKVGHHGSKSSSSEAFLKLLQPDVAVISVGAGNRFGHPVTSVLDRLRYHCGQVYRTDRDGTVTYVSDGLRYRVSTRQQAKKAYASSH